MCDLQRGLFCRTFSTGAGDAGSADLIVEALAQVGAVAVLMQEENKGKLGYFGGIKNCKFRRKVVPGDKLKLEARIIRQKGPLVIGEAVASVDGEVAVKAELSLMIGKAETDD